MAMLPPSRYFPPAEYATEEGLVAIGGCLEPDWLLDAYQHGIFPWPCGDDRWPIPWFSPDPRAVLEFDRLHISRSLRRTLRKGIFQVTCDQAFAEVIRGCAEAPGRRGATWITPAMIRAYCRLHQLGYTHSVEVWQDEKLVGGVYGVAVGGAFSAESMFHLVSDASKVALVHLVRRLQAQGYQLVDVQEMSPHLARLGARTIPRQEFLRRLAEALTLPVQFGPPGILHFHWP
ncbi:MAG: leucyl/phenylalanyl-tRNA--protein transferase [Thermoguttaceae bacterium]|nr:leucyl/phenylalanyl-tRNA--protein transferase [Thermoguttaceae bacterium]MDW8038128.1 leucyl/phenylalanyl-tRNA--protein transferase [Thermoguttaceae bacterium]